MQADEVLKILVTGANGFIGRRLCTSLQQSGFEVIKAVRLATAVDKIAVGNIGPHTKWGSALATCPEIVIHLASRVHPMKGEEADFLSVCRAVNVQGTLNFARQAAAAGVKRFIFISSIKVNGESSLLGRPFRDDDTPAPEDPYGISKHEAEQALHQVARETSMEVVIIRPPLVYGPGVKANFALMTQWLARGLPLPFAAVTDNRRSLVSLDNLVDLIIVCASLPAAGNQTFLVSDGQDLSTADLLVRMGVALGKPARLFHLPTSLLKLIAIATRSLGVYRRLCGSLQVDTRKTRHMLGWTPPLSVDEGLSRAFKHDGQ
jgi:nucleoside-diphosphate-sugar epimerase